jgi:hypothetical protein
VTPRGTHPRVRDRRLTSPLSIEPQTDNQRAPHAGHSDLTAARLPQARTVVDLDIRGETLAELPRWLQHLVAIRVPPWPRRSTLSAA